MAAREKARHATTPGRFRLRCIGKGAVRRHPANDRAEAMPAMQAFPMLVPAYEAVIAAMPPRGSLAAGATQGRRRHLRLIRHPDGIAEEHDQREGPKDRAEGHH